MDLFQIIVDIFDGSGGNKAFNCHGPEATSDSKDYDKIIDAEAMPLNMIGRKKIIMSRYYERTRILTLQ